ASRQRGECIAPRLQAGVAKLRNQALHDPVFFRQIAADLFPISGRREHDLDGVGAQEAASQVVPVGESFSTMPLASRSLRMRSASAKFFAAFAAARASIQCWI